MEKSVILPTPQRALVEHFDAKPLPADGRLRFVLVGHMFYRKGGRAIVRALETIRSEGGEVELTIVSRLEPDGFLDTSAQEQQEMREYLRATPWIRWYEQLPNQKVLELFRSSHIGVLLSFAEAYGYSVLEAEANACAVITTDIGALPELNSSESGWIVPIRDVSFDLADPQSLRRLEETVVARLVPLLRAIVASPEQLREKGMGALEKIRKQHDPEHHRGRLEQYYCEALEA